MPLPTDVHIDTLLTGVMAGSQNDGYIGREVLPVIPSGKETGFIGKMGEDHYRVDFPARAPGSQARRIDYDVSKLAYAAEEWCLEFPIDRRTRNNYDDPYDADRDATMVLRAKIDLKIETLVATLLTTAANYPAAQKDTNAKAWDAAGKPSDDVGDAVEAIQDATGSALVNIHGACSHKVWKVLQQNLDIKTIHLNTVPGAAGRGSLTQAQVAATLGLVSLQVGSAIQITSLEGATVVKSAVWGIDKFLVYAKTPNGGIMVPNLGYIIVPQIPGFPGLDTIVDRYMDESAKSEIIRATMIADQLLTDTNYGFLFDDVLT